MKELGQRIAAMRERTGLKQEDLALELGISRASLSHYETGRRTPDFEVIAKLADYFRVSIDYLVGRINEPAAAGSADPANPDDPDDKVAAFIRHLDLSDEQLLARYALTVDGQRLTPQEARRFIAFIRAERALD